MPATLTLFEGCVEICKQAVNDRARYWVLQLGEKLDSQFVSDVESVRGIVKRFIFLELINVGIELSRSAFVDIDKLFGIIANQICHACFRMDNGMAKSTRRT
jgi:hypothetical protein